MNSERLYARVRRHEAVKRRLYFDSKGILTGGIGHALGNTGVALEVQRAMLAPGVMDRDLGLETIERWFAQDITTAENETRHLALLRGVDFDRLGDLRQEVLVEMGFQMGSQRLGGFTKMWAALAAADWITAAREGRDSKWHREDSPERAQELMRVMEWNVALMGET